MLDSTQPLRRDLSVGGDWGHLCAGHVDGRDRPVSVDFTGLLEALQLEIGGLSDAQHLALPL